MKFSVFRNRGPKSMGAKNMRGCFWRETFSSDLNFFFALPFFSIQFWLRFQSAANISLYKRTELKNSKKKRKNEWIVFAKVWHGKKVKGIVKGKKRTALALWRLAVKSEWHECVNESDIFFSSILCLSLVVSCWSCLVERSRRIQSHYLV